MRKNSIVGKLFLGILIMVLFTGCSKASDTLLIADEPQRGNELRTGVEEGMDQEFQQDMEQDMEEDMEQDMEQVMEEDMEQDMEREPEIKQKKDSELNLEGTGTNSANKGITVNYINFEVMEIGDVPEVVAADVELLKLNRGYRYWQQEDGSYYIFISAGEKSTGGYGIEVEAVEDNEGKTVISVVETEPGADTMTIQILTYPYVIIKLKGITDQFIVKDQYQSEYSIIGDIIPSDGC